MDGKQERRPNEAELSQAFKEMGLETTRQRNEVLARQNSVFKESPPIPYVIRLSNSSQPAPTVA